MAGQQPHRVGDLRPVLERVGHPHRHVHLAGHGVAEGRVLGVGGGRAERRAHRLDVEDQVRQRVHRLLRARRRLQLRHGQRQPEREVRPRQQPRQVEVLRNKYQSERIRIHVTGFAKVVGDLIEGLQQVLMFFGLALAICAAVLPTAPAAPDRVAASLMLNRSEMNAVPRPSSSASRTSSMRSRGDFGAPASR